ncbi:Zinc transporter 2 [Trichinella spiralis]|uniref:Zinc transporter 2 n=1 Tax=Trichinella spiralis TaxID=6334 RepID=A0A0V1B7F2_TRISP|nr:Zinc transporter 2 [Trichinella spiralis]
MVDNYSFEQEKVPIYRQSAAALKFSRPCEKMIEMKNSDCKHSYFPDYQSSSSHICSCYQNPAPTVVLNHHHNNSNNNNNNNNNNGSKCLSSDSESKSTEENDSDVSNHCHNGSRKIYSTNSRDKRVLLISIFLCFFFMAAEIIGGYFAGSLAIMTDAAHLLTDLASFLISLFSMYVASRPATRRMSFGWHRAEVLGALVSVILIWVITGILVYIAIERLIYRTFDIDAKVMMITAAVGVLVNLMQKGFFFGFLMASVLHCLGGHGHSHNSASSANHLKSNIKESKNINVRAAFIHVLGDFCQSVGVLAAAFVIYYKPDLTIVDPICTFIFSVLVLITTVNIVKDVLNVLMEGSPRSISFNEVFSTLRSIEGVEKVHDLHIWSLTMDKIALSVHLAVNNDCNAQELLKNATSTLRRRYNVYESTVQIERFSNDMVQCLRCEPPNL